MRVKEAAGEITNGIIYIKIIRFLFFHEFPHCFSKRVVFVDGKPLSPMPFLEYTGGRAAALPHDRM